MFLLRALPPLGGGRSYVPFAGAFRENASAALPDTCDGDDLTFGGALFNEATCAPDFTYGYNVSAIVAQIPLAALQTAGQTTFDTWSTISLPQ